VAGVKVDLYTADGTFVATQATDENGKYLFTELNAGSYYVEFANVPGFAFTKYNVNGNSQDAMDSDPVVPLVEVSASDGGMEGKLGQPLTYTFYYTNTDTQLAATDVVISTTVPLGTTFTPGNSGWECVGGSTLVTANTVCTFNIPTVAANSSGSTTFVVTIGSTDSEVPNLLDLLINLTHGIVARTNVVTLEARETNLTVDAGIVRTEASLQTAVPTSPTNLPPSKYPPQGTFMFLPTVRSGE
jgi:uncharacterized repeat protein (TIGR01451 family)